MAIPLSPWPLVRVGDRGTPVRSLQYLLRAHGHDLVVDGVFGPVTEVAVRAFQKEGELVVDGVVGPITWRALIIEVAQGSTGDAVRAGQDQLQSRVQAGNPDLAIQIDGIFGPRTDAVVRTFQRRVAVAVTSFPVDGIVGPLTWQALVGGMLTD